MFQIVTRAHGRELKHTRLPNKGAPDADKASATTSSFVVGDGLMAEKGVSLEDSGAAPSGTPAIGVHMEAHAKRFVTTPLPWNASDGSSERRHLLHAHQVTHGTFTPAAQGISTDAPVDQVASTDGAVDHDMQPGHPEEAPGSSTALSQQLDKTRADERPLAEPIVAVEGDGGEDSDADDTLVAGGKVGAGQAGQKNKGDKDTDKTEKMVVQEVDMVQVDLVIRDGAYSTVRDMHTYMQGLYRKSSGRLQLWTVCNSPECGMYMLGGFKDGAMRGPRAPDSLITGPSAPALNTTTADEDTMPYGFLGGQDRTHATGNPYRASPTGAAPQRCIFLMNLLVEKRNPFSAESAGSNSLDDSGAQMGLDVGEVPRAAHRIALTGNITSDNCGFSLHVNATAMNFEVYYTKAMHYTLMVSFYPLFLCIPRLSSLCCCALHCLRPLSFSPSSLSLALPLFLPPSLPSSLPPALPPAIPPARPPSLPPLRFPHPSLPPSCEAGRKNSIFWSSF